VDREKTCPFLLRTFVKVNGFHNLSLFEDNRLPIEDEHQLYTWKDATLRELVTYVRSLPPTSLSLTLRHPAARYSFKLVFPDATSRGRMTTKELGSVTAKDVAKVSDLRVADAPDSTMELDTPTSPADTKGDQERTLDELRVVPGDWLLVAVHVPAKAMGLSIAGAAGPSTPAGFGIRGAAPIAAPGAGRGLRGSTDAGWGRGRGDPALGGHWRGRGAAPATGRGGPGRDADRERERRDADRAKRPSPSGRDRDRRPSPTGRDRDADRHRSRSRSPAKSRSRSPPRRR